MKDSSDPSHDLEDDILDDGSGDTEANQRLINQLKSRIVELEMRGDHLMNEKEQLEVRRRGRGRRRRRRRKRCSYKLFK